MNFLDGLCSVCPAELEEEVVRAGASLQFSALLLCLGSPVPGGIDLSEFPASGCRFSNLPVCWALLCNSLKHWRPVQP